MTPLGAPGAYRAGAINNLLTPCIMPFNTYKQPIQGAPGAYRAGDGSGGIGGEWIPRGADDQLSRTVRHRNVWTGGGQRWTGGGQRWRGLNGSMDARMNGLDT